MAVAGGRIVAEQASRAVGWAWSLLLLALLGPSCGPCSGNGVPPALGEESGEPFRCEQLREEARRLAGQPYAQPPPDLPGAVAGLTRQEVEQIRYRRSEALWQHQPTPFRVQLYPRSPAFPRRVEIDEVVEGRAVPVTFRRELFEFGGNEALKQRIPEDLGFAGLRLLYPLHEPGRFDEVASFLGATYFRAVGREQVYGTSGRGLALDTGLALPEEFPFFFRFWLIRPGPEEHSATLCALMDSPGATGAYRFEVTPGEATWVAVQAEIFVRRPVERFGLAPLTSMFLSGLDRPLRLAGQRSAEHDADGLLLDLGREWLWRPLRNPPRAGLSSFYAEQLRGFGLMQRLRRAESYGRSPFEYERRPGVWVEPRGGWGRGAVQLLELPSDTPDYDNIAAFWAPAQRPPAGEQLSLRYRLRFALDDPPAHRGARVAGSSFTRLAPRSTLISVRWEEVRLPRPEEEEPVEAIVTVRRGRALNVAVHRESLTGWVLGFELADVSEEEESELRAFLRQGSDVLGETWSFTWPP